VIASAPHSFGILSRRRRRATWKLLVLLGAGLLLGLTLALGWYSLATAPQPVPGRSPQRAFDPVRTGRLEQQAWVHYYYRRWPQLFDLLLRLSRGQFNLSLPQALYASYLATQAQIVFARQGDQDGLAESYMRRFYEFVREPVGGQYDPERAAQLEIRWWVVHRQRANQPDRSALVDALAASYAEVYQQPAERLRPAAEARALAMDLSDQWQAEGKDPDSPLLEQIADLLVESYRALIEATAQARPTLVGGETVDAEAG
jgi:hypothetical protein